MTALDFFFADRRPQAWNGWAEVVGRDLREPRFIGDMPHAWISSDYIRSALDLFVYERDADHALVLAAGLPMSWIDSATGVGVREVRTPYGPLTYALRRRAGRDDPDPVAGRDAAGRLRAAMAGGRDPAGARPHRRARRRMDGSRAGHPGGGAAGRTALTLFGRAGRA